MDTFDSVPIWMVFVVTLILVLVATEIGFRLGCAIKRRGLSQESTSTSGALVGGMLGLMAFILAFSVGIVTNQQSARRAMVVTEANAIGTAYLRAGFLEPSAQDAVRALLREYVEIRLAARMASEETGRPALKKRSEEIHGALWTIVEGVVDAGGTSATMALFVDSVNEVIDVHSLRLSAAHLRLPRLLGITLYVATVLSFLLVGIAESSDGKRSIVSMVLFAVAFSIVLTIIVDVNRPLEGHVKTSQAALSDLLQQMSPAGQ